MDLPSVRSPIQSTAQEAQERGRQAMTIPFILLAILVIAIIVCRLWIIPHHHDDDQKPWNSDHVEGDRGYPE